MKDLRAVFGEHLEEYASFRALSGRPIGGSVDYYLKAPAINDLVSAIGQASSLALPFVVLGTASQTILSDFGFSGLVIHNQAKRIVPSMDRVRLLVDSGVTWNEVAIESANLGFGGLEAALGIFGTIGGAWATGRLEGDLAFIRSYIAGYTFLEEDGSITTRREARSTNLPFPILLVVHFQLLRRRPDEILRRIRSSEMIRRKIDQLDQAWIGPVFQGVEESHLQAMFDRYGVFKRRVPGFGFSKARPNYLEIDRPTEARSIRNYISEVASILLSEGTSPLSVNIHFLGKW